MHLNKQDEPYNDKIENEMFNCEGKVAFMIFTDKDGFVKAMTNENKLQ